MIKPPGLWPHMADPTHLHTCFPLGPRLPASSPASAKGTATKPAAHTGKKLEVRSAPPYQPPGRQCHAWAIGPLKKHLRPLVSLLLPRLADHKAGRTAEPPSSASLRTRNVGGHSHARPQVGPHSATTGAPLGHCHVTRERAPRGPGAVVSGRRLRASGLRLADTFR